MSEFLKHARNRYLFVVDILIIALAQALTTLLVFPISQFQQYFAAWIPNLVASEAIYVLSLFSFGIYHVYWLHATTREYARLLAATSIAAVVNFCVCAFVLHSYAFPKFNLSVNVLIIGIVFLMRFSVKLFGKMHLFSANTNGKRVLIIGAGALSAMLLRDINDDKKLDYHVVGLIDDDKYKLNSILCGARVLGNRKDIIRICREKNVEEIIFSIVAIDKKEKNNILEICTETGCTVKTMSGFEGLLSGRADIKGARKIQIEDLLDRETIHLDNEQIAGDICGKTVLVTGGGGSIGSELCRQIANYQPARLVIVDVYENSTYEVENELLEKYPDLQLSVLIASVRDEQRLEEIFAQYRPELVFHAAAHKHVPLMEHSPAEAVKNNVFGTYHVAKCADKFGVRRFIMISTDKAVNPTNVMGATKRMCEMIVQTMSKQSKTDFVSVRFGNVLGSNGSVIPRFKKQIEAGGPVTVTHPEITRFFMTIPEAANLVLQAASYAGGGEIFVLDMGEPVKIYDLAKKMITLAGYEPDKEMDIVFTGLRPGEKLYEELLMNEEGLKQTEHSKIFIGKPIDITPEELEQKLDILMQALSQDNDAVKAALRETVPTYIPAKQ